MLSSDLLQKFEEHRTMKVYHPEVIEHWAELVAHRARAFDAAPAGESLSAADRADVQELRQLVHKGRGEREAFDIRRHGQETIDAGNRIFPHTREDQKTLDRGQHMFDRTEDGAPISFIERIQASAAASCGMTIPRHTRTTDTDERPQLDERNEKLQAAYDAIRTGQRV
jgi:hypothetical protein